MKKNEIVAGGKYIAKVGNNITTVRVEEIGENWLGKTCYSVVNLKTNRKTTFRSAAKFRKAAI